MNVHPSCGCTTAQLPPMPWVLEPAANGQIKLTVNLAGKSGTLFKTVSITTDKGSKTLMLQIKILPPVVPTLTDADRMAEWRWPRRTGRRFSRMIAPPATPSPAMANMVWLFITPFVRVCHEAEHRATMVPDLHTLKVPTNDQFWRIWIAHGKPGSLMPAFSNTDGGPLNDLQIASLAAYLNVAIPSRVAPQAQ